MPQSRGAAAAAAAGDGGDGGWLACLLEGDEGGGTSTARVAAK